MTTTVSDMPLQGAYSASGTLVDPLAGPVKVTSKGTLKASISVAEDGSVSGT